MHDLIDLMIAVEENIEENMGVHERFVDSPPPDRLTSFLRRANTRC